VSYFGLCEKSEKEDNVHILMMFIEKIFFSFFRSFDKTSFFISIIEKNHDHIYLRGEDIAKLKNSFSLSHSFILLLPPPPLRSILYTASLFISFFLLLFTLTHSLA
jgi:hypothetical protein